MKNLRETLIKLSSLLHLSERESVFHGTSNIQGRKILENGFSQNGNKNWDSDLIVSLDGLYVTRSLPAAIGYGLDARNKTDSPGIMILILEIDNIDFSFDIVNLQCISDFCDELKKFPKKLLQDPIHRINTINLKEQELVREITKHLKVSLPTSILSDLAKDVLNFFYDIALYHNHLLGKALKDPAILSRFEEIILRNRGFPHKLILPSRDEKESVNKGPRDLLGKDNPVYKILGAIECLGSGQEKRVINIIQQQEDKKEYIARIASLLEKDLSNSAHRPKPPSGS